MLCQLLFLKRMPALVLDDRDRLWVWTCLILLLNLILTVGLLGLLIHLAQLQKANEKTSDSNQQSEQTHEESRNGQPHNDPIAPALNLGQAFRSGDSVQDAGVVGVIQKFAGSHTAWVQLVRHGADVSDHRGAVNCQGEKGMAP